MIGCSPTGQLSLFFIKDNFLVLLVKKLDSIRLYILKKIDDPVQLKLNTPELFGQHLAILK